MTKTTAQDVVNSQTFPQDFYFGDNPGKGIVTYVCGMSVPPIMMKRVVERVIQSGIFESEQLAGDARDYVEDK